MAKEPTVFTLTETLKTHNGEVRELKLRTPKARLFMRYGDAFKITPAKSEDEPADFVFNNEIMVKYLADMTGVDELILEEMPSGDFYNLRQLAVVVILGVVREKDPSSQPVA